MPARAVKVAITIPEGKFREVEAIRSPGKLAAVNAAIRFALSIP